MLMRTVLLAGVLALGLCPASAQSYPTRAVRVIVPFAAGGTPDVVARLVAQQMAAQSGQSVVVENRPGADGVVGAKAVADSPADGYTLLVTSSSFTNNPSFHKTLPFDVIRDFAPVTNLAATEAYILGVNPGFKAQTVKELLAIANQPGNHVSFASPGIGNSLHLAAELFKSLTKAPIVHVPYRGAAPALTGLMSGDVQMMFMTPPSSFSYVESGKIRPLAYTGAKRYKNLPDVPTMTEAGVPGMEELSSWTGMFAPGRTPPDVLAQIQAAAKRALETPSVRERLNSLGAPPVGNTPAEFKTFVAQQVKQTADIVKAAGIEPQ